MHMCVEMRLLRSRNTAWASETKSAFNINDSLTWDQKEWLVNVCTPRATYFTDHHGRRKRGTGGRVPRSRKISGGRPPRSYNRSVYFFLKCLQFFTFSNIFEIKWPKSEKKLNFWGRWVWVPMNPSPTPNHNLVSTPLPTVGNVLVFESRIQCY